MAPITTGFNEAACDTFGGTYCYNPRPCDTLKSCIEDLRTEAKKYTTKKAYFQYLSDAPKITDVRGRNVEECRNTREYFGFDPDFSDDDYICDEIEAIQCLEKFTNLDGMAEGVPREEREGGGGGEGKRMEVLVLNAKMVKQTKGMFL